jgi:hypothetical protein
MSEKMDINSNNWVRLPIAAFHTLEAACENLEKDSKALSHDDRMRKPYSAEELQDGVLRRYHCRLPTTDRGDWRGL